MRPRMIWRRLKKWLSRTPLPLEDEEGELFLITVMEEELEEEGEL